MLERFYTPELLTEGTLALDGGQAHHLLNVMRMKIGQRVCLFDGRGTEATAEIVAAGRRQVELNVVSTQTTDDDTLPLVLATAVPKGDRFRWLVEKATELGVERLLPLRTARSVVDPGSGKLRKMEQTVIAACKQSGRSRLMPIAPPVDWADFIAGHFAGRTVLLAHPGGEALGHAINSEDVRPLLGVIGPEGGLTTDEIDQAVDAGARRVGLGPSILRIETAAVALAAVCRALRFQ